MLGSQPMRSGLAGRAAKGKAVASGGSTEGATDCRGVESGSSDNAEGRGADGGCGEVTSTVGDGGGVGGDDARDADCGTDGDGSNADVSGSKVSECDDSKTDVGDGGDADSCEADGSRRPSVHSWLSEGADKAAGDSDPTLMRND